MPRYKSIKGIILTQEPLIKTTTNKLKRQNNLEQVKKDAFWNGFKKRENI